MAQHTVTLIPGDGIGLETSAAMQQVVEAAGADIVWEVAEAGAACAEKTGTPLPDETIEAVKRNKVAIKGPCTTPVGTGFRSVNVALRKTLDLYVCLRPVLSMPGAGGRYDGLLEQLGGPAVPGIGFALGLERLVAMLAAAGHPGADAQPHAYLIMVGDAAQRQGLALAERLRDQVPTLRLRMHCGGGGFKAQFRRADHSGARFALILGEDEVRAGVIAIKSLRDPDAQQLTLSYDQAAAHLRAVLDSTSPL